MLRLPFITLLLFVGLVAVGCGSPQGGNTAATPEGKPSSAAGGDSGGAQEFTLHKVMDSEGTGKLAGTYLVPKGWSPSDKVTWITNDFLTPVVGRFKITSPDGVTQLDEVSEMSVTFGHGPMGGSGMAPPKSVSTFLLRGWKQEHPGVGISVVSQKDTPIKDSYFAGVGAPVTYAQSGAVTLKYKASGKLLLAKLYARMDVMSTGAMPTAMGRPITEGSWLMSNMWTGTAPEGEFPAAMKLFGVILSSYRIDPHFFNTVTQCQRIIQQNFYNGIRQIQETSRIISETNDQISDSIMQGYERTEAAQDHEVQNFDDYIRGVQRYNDDGGSVALPNEYNHAWSDGNGNYLMTSATGWDPNSSGVQGNWHELEEAH